MPKVNEYDPLDGRVSLPEDVVVGGGGPEMSEPNKKEPVGIIAPPVILTVPESVAVVMVGAAKLRGLVAICDPKFVLRPDVENVAGGTNEDADWDSCTVNVPAGRLTE